MVMTRGLIIRDGTNTPRTITEIQVRDGTNTPRDISEIRVRDSNNVSRIVFSLAPDLSASAAPETVYGAASLSTITTGSTTVTPVGGTPPYSHAWSLDTFDGPVAPTANSPTSATTTFTQTSVAPGDSYYASWIDTVTDDDGATATATATSFWTHI
jgi:hypothetical protein